MGGMVFAVVLAYLTSVSGVAVQMVGLASTVAAFSPDITVLFAARIIAGGAHIKFILASVSRT